MVNRGLARSVGRPAWPTASQLANALLGRRKCVPLVPASVLRYVRQRAWPFRIYLSPPSLSLSLSLSLYSSSCATSLYVRFKIYWRIGVHLACGIGAIARFVVEADRSIASLVGICPDETHRLQMYWHEGTRWYAVHEIFSIATRSWEIANSNSRCIKCNAV